MLWLLEVVGSVWIAVERALVSRGEKLWWGSVDKPDWGSTPP